jgi:hypothetical protein
MPFGFVGGLTAPGEVGAPGAVGVIGMPPTLGACGVVDGGSPGLVMLSPGDVCSGSAFCIPLVGGVVVVVDGIADVVPTAVVFSGVAGVVAVGGVAGATSPEVGAASVVGPGGVVVVVTDEEGGATIVDALDGVDGVVVAGVVVAGAADVLDGDVDGEEVPPNPGVSWPIVGLRSVGTSGRDAVVPADVVPRGRTRSPSGIPSTSGPLAARGSASTESEAAASAIR